MANDRVEKQIESLKALRGAEPTAEVTAALKKALVDRVNLVVAKAAQISGEIQTSSLIPDLKKAFERLFEKDKDPQCWGKNALVKTLKDLGVQESAVFLRGVRHIQLEPVWGGQADTAETLRGACAMALVQCNDIPRDEILRHLVDSLTDGGATVRTDAAQALGQMGGNDVSLLLRLKAKVGDKDPHVTGQVLEALLELEEHRAISFVAGFLESTDEEVADEAALALGTSRIPEAVTLLMETFRKRSPFRPSSALLRAISASRLDTAISFLISMVEDDDIEEAEEALHALSLHKGTEELLNRIQQAVTKRGEEKLRRVFAERFLS